mmetsp:Transcript_41611/g.107664  ORF Transcript_41611/g.107664 Transcript_41611/m.107664 type:complete len:255 (+) Transcript_41611:109-873(+)
MPPKKASAASARGPGRPRAASSSSAPAAEKGVLRRRPAAAGAKTELSDAERKHRQQRRMKTSSTAFVRDWKRKGHAYRLVWKGLKKKTSGGLLKKNLVQNKRGAIVSKLRHSLGLYRYKMNGLDVWMQSMMGARESMGAGSFIKIRSAANGGSKQEAELYQRTHEAFLKKAVDKFNTKMAGRGTKAVLRVLKDEGPTSPGAAGSPGAPASTGAAEEDTQSPGRPGARSPGALSPNPPPALLAARRRPDGSVDVD